MHEISDKGATQLTRALLHLFATHGLPLAVHIDNAIVSAQLRRTCELYGVSLKPGIPYNSNSQAKIENRFGTITRTCAKMRSQLLALGTDAPPDIEPVDLVQRAVLAYNMTMRQTETEHAYSPLHLFLGRAPRQPQAHMLLHGNQSPIDHLIRDTDTREALEATLGPHRTQQLALLYAAHAGIESDRRDLRAEQRQRTVKHNAADNPHIPALTKGDTILVQHQPTRADDQSKWARKRRWFHATVESYDPARKAVRFKIFTSDPDAPKAAHLKVYERPVSQVRLPADGGADAGVHIHLLPRAPDGTPISTDDGTPISLDEFYQERLNALPESTRRAYEAADSALTKAVRDREKRERKEQAEAEAAAQRERQRERERQAEEERRAEAEAARARQHEAWLAAREHSARFEAEQRARQRAATQQNAAARAAQHARVAQAQRLARERQLPLVRITRVLRAADGAVTRVLGKTAVGGRDVERHFDALSPAECELHPELRAIAATHRRRVAGYEPPTGPA